MNSEQLLAFERLKAIHWEATGEVPCDDKIHELFSRFRAQSGRICNSHGIKPTFYGNFEYIETILGETILIPEAFALEWNNILRKGYHYRGSYLVYHSGLEFIRWHGLSCEKKFLISGSDSSSNPFELLIKFFEAGGAFSTEHGMLDRVFP